MANTTNFGWETPDDTDLVKDGAAAIRTLAGAIDTSLVDLKGGTTGQVLAKNSNTDMDFVWSADASGIPATIFDAKGDLIVASAADTAARLASSASNGDVLTVDTSTATGLKWASPAGGGKVLQVVYASTATTAISSSATWADTNLTATITPSSATSKILVLVNQNGCLKFTSANALLGIRLLRGSTTILTIGELFLFTNTTMELYGTTVSASYLDEPATTSATTYKTQFNNANASPEVQVQANANHRSTITLLEIGA